MKLSTLIAAPAAILALGAASAALAQAPAPAPPVLTANIAGVCVFTQAALFENSTVGKAVNNRLEQLKSQVQAELTADQTSFQNDYQALEQKKATLQPQQLAQQQQALQQRYDALQQKAEQRSREMQATQQKAYARVIVAAQPLFADAIKQRNCAVVMDGQAVLAFNNAMDVTQPVVVALNSKLTTFDFEREHLEAQAGQQR
jgi:Skp family chaperone for outer membrane proteins